MSALDLIDLRSRVREPETLSLLSRAVGHPTNAKLEAIASTYESDSSRFLSGFSHRNSVIALIGGELRPAAGAVLLHIVVRPERRQQGLGRSLIDSICERYGLREIVAETDHEALSFYERCGFTITPLKECYSSVERFSCRWTAT